MWWRSIKCASLPSLNNAIQGDDGGYGAVYLRACAVASVSCPAKTVTSDAGFFALLLAVGICSVFGGITLIFNFQDQSYDISMTLLKSLVVFAIGAIAEEVLFRGYIFQTLTRAKLETVAIVITSLLFSFAHNGNDNVTVFGLVNTALAGIWFGFAYLKTRSLWFAFGIHLFWNWTLAAFCGSLSGAVTDLLHRRLHPFGCGT